MHFANAPVTTEKLWRKLRWEWKLSLLVVKAEGCLYLLTTLRNLLQSCLCCCSAPVYVTASLMDCSKCCPQQPKVPWQCWSIPAWRAAWGHRHHKALQFFLGQFYWVGLNGVAAPSPLPAAPGAMCVWRSAQPFSPVVSAVPGTGVPGY